jgi:3-methyladenine DNA glycosylase AlkD
VPPVDRALARLRACARPDQLEGMARFGIVGPRRLGVSVPELRRIGRELGRDHPLALALWRTGIPDARILASLVGDPEQLTAAQMDAWAGGFRSWDVCDQVCMNLFDRSPLAWGKVREWARSEEEFVKRAAFALTASLASHDRVSDDARFERLLPLIARAATDERNFVKKAVNWALRGIGKRSRRLNRAAVAAAREIRLLDSRSARWIAADALRELTGEAVQGRLRARAAAARRGPRPPAPRG